MNDTQLATLRGHVGKPVLIELYHRRDAFVRNEQIHAGTTELYRGILHDAGEGFVSVDGFVLPFRWPARASDAKPAEVDDWEFTEETFVTYISDGNGTLFHDERESVPKELRKSAGSC
ncbi:MAG: hypothetical protein ABIG30_01185 [Candidatus Aenigmatarchaeota archaeon]